MAPGLVETMPDCERQLKEEANEIEREINQVKTQLLEKEEHWLVQEIKQIQAQIGQRKRQAPTAPALMKLAAKMPKCEVGVDEHERKNSSMPTVASADTVESQAKMSEAEQAAKRVEDPKEESTSQAMDGGSYFTITWSEEWLDQDRADLMSDGDGSTGPDN